MAIDAYLAVALVIAAIIAVFALGTSNYGTAFRHRAKAFPWLLLLYLYGTAIRYPRSFALGHGRLRRCDGRIRRAFFDRE